MFNRDIIADLKKWTGDPERKPLILRGARQVGKTTAVHQFAQDFDQYIYLMLEHNEDRNLFSSEKSFADILAAIFFSKNIARDNSKKTLIFIDEIQNSPTAVAMMRYFYENAKDLFVVAGGSLLEVLLDKEISFPVGRVEYKFMYPLTFSEFLGATGETQALQLLDTIPVPKFAHAKLLELFHRYTLLGGMPEVIRKYIATKDIVSLNPIYQNLMIAYADDVEKYTRNVNARNLVRHAIENAPLAAGKRIKFHGFGASNYGSREMGEALRSIEKAMLISLVYPTSATSPPIIADQKKSPKLQFLDTGLVNYKVGLQKYFFALQDLNSLYQGIIVEHIVGQELIAIDNAPNKLYFWAREKAQSNAEVDFVLPFNSHVIPIEVKAGKTGTLRSLHQFIDATDHAFGVRLCANEFCIEETKTVSGKKFILLNLPYYLTAKVNYYLEKYFE